MNPINWFEIPVTDMARAKKFYEHILDIEISLHDFDKLLMGWFPFNHEAPGATGSLVQGKDYIPSHHGSMVYFIVKEIDNVLPKITSVGGKIINPKFEIGDHGFVAHFEDSEGNRIALHQGK
ncbi:MAG: VOC family protein [Cyclobacteriaceae bacterium]